MNVIPERMSFISRGITVVYWMLIKLHVSAYLAIIRLQSSTRPKIVVCGGCWDLIIWPKKLYVRYKLRVSRYGGGRWAVGGGRWAVDGGRWAPDGEISTSATHKQYLVSQNFATWWWPNRPKHVVSLTSNKTSSVLNYFIFIFTFIVTHTTGMPQLQNVELGFPFDTRKIYFDSAALFRQMIHKMLRNAGAPKVWKATKENINICLDSTV